MCGSLPGRWCQGEGATWAPTLSSAPVSPKTLPAPLTRPGPPSVQRKRASFLPHGTCPPSPNNGAVVPSPPHPFILLWLPSSLSLSLVCPKEHPTRPNLLPTLQSTSLVVLSPFQFLLPRIPDPLLCLYHSISYCIFVLVSLCLGLSVYLCLSVPLTILPLPPHYLYHVPLHRWGLAPASPPALPSWRAGVWIPAK